MTVQEFSDQFDVLYNNITSNQAPGLNEYEKSVFLTKAQDEVIKNHFLANSKGNTLGQGFDENPKRQIDFSMLMRTEELTSITPSGTVSIHFGSNTKYFAMPANILIYINEVLNVLRDGHGLQLTVVPISFDEYSRLMSKPFKRPVKYQAWRLITVGAASSYTYTNYGVIATAIAGLNDVTASAQTILTTINGCILSVTSSNKLKVGDMFLENDGTLSNTIDANSVNVSSIATLINNSIDIESTSADTIVEIVPGQTDSIQTYVIRYLARPTPIILSDLSSEHLSINGKTARTECILDPILHEEILQRAVELAKVAWQGDVQTVTQAGQRSE